MAEHTPAPTPNRAVYGFAWFLFFKTLFVLYVLWAFVPDHILVHTFGLTYLPDKYFALYIPILVLCGLTIFAFLIYPPLNLSMQIDLNDPNTIYDQYTIRRCTHVCGATGLQCENKIKPTLNGNEAIWQKTILCELHEQRRPEDQPIGMNVPMANGDCDCTDKTKCLLTKKRNHLNVMAERKTVPTVYDLDLSDVCARMFRQRRNMEIS